MKKKRISAVVVIKNSIVVQSFSFKNYLPVGNPEVVIENLNSWGADEIIILDIDSSKYNLEPNYDLLEKISNKNLSTPIIYAGGIRDEKMAINVINSGAERVAIGNYFLRDIKIFEKINSRLGSQAIILILNFISRIEGLFIYDYVNDTKCDINKFSSMLQNIDKFYSELMLVDVSNDGSPGNFNKKILKEIKIKKNLILFGGLNNVKKINYLLNKDNVQAIAIGNSFNYKEHALQELKIRLNKKWIRAEIYNE
jgi:cyclase